MGKYAALTTTGIFLIMAQASSLDAIDPSGDSFS